MPLLDHCDDVVTLMVTFLAFIMIVARDFDFDFDVHLSCAFLQGLSFLMHENRNHDVNFL